MGLEDDRGKQLDPIGDQLPVVGLAQLTGVGVEAKAAGAIAGDAGGAHVGGAGADGREPLGNPSGDELVMARRLWALSPLHVSLALIAGVVPGLLPRQQLGEHVGLAGAARRALITLAAVAGRAVGAVQLDPRALVLRPGALHPRCADPRHRPKLASQSDGLAQRDARGGRQVGET